VTLSVASGARCLITQANEWRLNEWAVAKRSTAVKSVLKTPAEEIVMISILNFLFLLIAVTFAQPALAREPSSADLRGAADARGQIEAQMEAAARAASSVTGRDLGSMKVAPAATPEKEMERRRKLINDAHRDFTNIVGSQRAPIGMDAAAASTAGRDLGGPLGEPSSGGKRGSSEDREPGIASARSGDSGFEGALSTSSEKRLVSAPPRAIAIEGRIIVYGGEGGAIASNRGEKNIRYSVEEKFVGNLVVAEPIEALVAKGSLKEEGVADARSGSDDFRGESSSGMRGDGVPLSEIGKPKGGKKPGGKPIPGDGVADARSAGGESSVKSSSGREYEIDTLSTGVQVKSVEGGVCLEPGEGDGACVRSARFSGVEVSTANRYGNMGDWVVMAETDGGKVRMEVEAPKVTFSTADGGVKADLGCSGAKFELSENEFRRLLDGRSLTLTKDVGEKGKGRGCAEGSTITLEIRAKGK